MTTIKSMLLSTLAAGIAAATLASPANAEPKKPFNVNPEYADAGKVYATNDGRLCIGGNQSHQYDIFGNEVLDDVMMQASLSYLDFLTQVFGAETAGLIGDAGMLMDRCRNDPVDGRSGFRTLCDICVGMDSRFSPHQQDKMLDALDVPETPIHTKVYGVSVYSKAVRAETRDSSGGHSKVNSTETHIRNYVATTRSRPYVEAFDRIMGYAGFNGEKINKIWASIADKNGVISRDRAAKLYDQWMR